MLFYYLKTSSILLLFLFIQINVIAEKVRYDNYRIYSITIDSDITLKWIHDMEKNGYQLWNALPSRVASAEEVINNNQRYSAEIIVAPHQFGEFMELTEKANVQKTILVNDIQKLIDDERPKIQSRVFDWTDYHTLDEIYGWFDEQMLVYPELTDFVVGQSYQNRTIRGFKLSHKPGNPGIFIESNIHAREWITSATATWILYELLTSWEPAVIDMAQNIDWYIMPVFNVDGFVYTHTTNRLWRKTRQNHATICYGTDPNRNFGFEWFTGGSSDDPCSENFAGPFAWSEPETAALAEYYSTIAESINIYISFHSSGQYLMFPYGHTMEPPPTFDLMNDIGLVMAEAIENRHGSDYIVGSSSVVLYGTSGSSVDWAYNEYNIPVALIFELRDRRGGPYGHLLPANQIIPNCEEIFDGFKAMVVEARQRGVI